VLQQEDAGLEEERRQLMRLQHGLEAGPVSAEQYDEYRQALETYNHHVVSRNGRVQQYQTVRERYATNWERHAALADSVREIAARMGEPYYSVPTPLEAARARGVITVDP